MKRFTTRDSDGVTKYFIKDEDRVCVSGNDARMNYISGDIINRLADLEDKTENGLLLELPCRINERMFFAMESVGTFECVVRGYHYDGIFISATIRVSGYTESINVPLSRLCATREEAEEVLKRLKEGD